MSVIHHTYYSLTHSLMLLCWLVVVAAVVCVEWAESQSLPLRREHAVQWEVLSEERMKQW